MPTASPNSRWSLRSRRSRTPAGARGCPTTRDGSARSSAAGSAASARSRLNDRAMFDNGPKHVSPLAVPLMMGNAAAAAVSMRHGLRGPAFGTVSACSSGADAIGTAIRAIRHGDAIAVVTGGAEAALTPLSRAAFGALDALSTSGISRPFDARRDGFVMGEGAGVLVLEEGDAARARGARILAVAARLRRDRRRPSRDRAAPDRRGRRRRDRAGARGRLGRAERRSSTSTPTAPRRRSTTAPRRSR